MTLELTSVALMVGAAVAALAGGLRWWRVAQREHYLSGSAIRFARRWWLSSVSNGVLLGAVLIGAVGVWWWSPIGWLSLAALIVGPIGLATTGTSSPLRWTTRLRRVAAVTGVFVIGLIVVAIATGQPGWSVAGAAAIPLVVDLALTLVAPLERALSERWVKRAAAKLASSGARVVAITGSYGKTTTKGYLHHLLSGQVSAVTTPASFNNRMGLARAINEHLVPGASVFVAEMGTYGKGEIASLCEFVPPDVAVITSIGPVHLERFGSEKAIVEAKREILANAAVAILNIDHPLLAEVADQEEGRLKVVRVSASNADVEVSVVDRTLRVDGETIGVVGPDVFGSNLAAAAAAAIQCGVSVEEIGRRLAGLPVAPHRREQSTSERGFVVIDDTYNSNPAGARAALDLLCSVPGEGRRVVVTPGMVEMGTRQDAENALFGQAVAERASDLVVVGRTNRRALVEGAKGGAGTVTVLSSRQEAVEWVRSRLGPGDAVLYENDLPDHYP